MCNYYAVQQVQLIYIVFRATVWALKNEPWHEISNNVVF